MKIGTAAIVVAIASATVSMSAARAATITSENFDSYTANTALIGTGGWTFLPLGANPEPNFRLFKPSGVNTSAITIANSSTDGQVWKMFNSPATIPAGTTDYYLTYWIKPYQSGTGYNGAMAGGCTTTAGTNPTDPNSGPTFGITGDATNGLRFCIRQAGAGSSFYSTDAINGGDWYQVCLQISVATTLSASKGTMWVRDVTAGETTFHTVTGLADVNINLLSASQNPANYTAWRVRANYQAQVDNLEFGTGTYAAVPEPAAMGLVALAGGMLLARRRI